MESLAEGIGFILTVMGCFTLGMAMMSSNTNERRSLYLASIGMFIAVGILYASYGR